MSWTLREVHTPSVWFHWTLDTNESEMGPQVGSIRGFCNNPSHASLHLLQTAFPGVGDRGKYSHGALFFPASICIEI